MTLTRRGKWTVAASAMIVVAATVLGFLVVTGKAPALIRRAAAGIGIGEPPPPPTCPLTGEPAPGGVVPDRPVLAVKVENLAEARPERCRDLLALAVRDAGERGFPPYLLDQARQERDAPGCSAVAAG